VSTPDTHARAGSHIQSSQKLRIGHWEKVANHADFRAKSKRIELFFCEEKRIELERCQVEIV